METLGAELGVLGDEASVIQVRECGKMCTERLIPSRCRPTL